MLHARLHREVAGVGIAFYPRVDGVGEAALLAHFGKEPAAHPRAEDGREECERELIGVEVGVGWDADDELRLVGLLLLFRDTRPILLRSKSDECRGVAVL